MISLDTIGDGSCLLHALAMAYFVPYRTQSLDDRPVSRRQIVRQLRSELANKLASPSDPLNPDGPSKFDLLGRGKVKDFGHEDYTLQALVKLLHSDDCLGSEIIEYVSNELDKDIYLLEKEKADVYVLGDDNDIYIKDRDSIVLLYTSGHYELVGLLEKGQMTTHFAPDSPFIQMLRQRIDALIKLGSQR